jgi:hypothetical protein
MVHLRVVHPAAVAALGEQAFEERHLLAAHQDLALVAERGVEAPAPAQRGAQREVRAEGQMAGVCEQVAARRVAAQGQRAREHVEVVAHPRGRRHREVGRDGTAVEGGLRVARRGAGIGGDPLRVDAHVVVGPHEELAARGLEREVARERLSLAFLVRAPDRQPARPALDDRGRVVGATVVDHDQVPLDAARDLEPGERLERRVEQTRAVPGADRDRHVKGIVHGTLGRAGARPGRDSVAVGGGGAIAQAPPRGRARGPAGEASR